MKAGKVTGRIKKVLDAEEERQTGPRPIPWICLTLLRVEFGGVAKISSNPRPPWFLRGCSLHSGGVRQRLGSPERQ